MKQLMLLTFLMITLSGCKNNEKKEVEEPMTEVEKVPLAETTKPRLEVGCYVFNENGDLVRFEITDINGNAVTGKLNYAYAEKDKNEGTFEGVLTGDKLFGRYTFMSEGVESIRDVAFKVEEDAIIEGFGEMNEDGTTFKDTTKLNYPSSAPLKKGPCN